MKRLWIPICILIITIICGLVMWKPNRLIYIECNPYKDIDMSPMAISNATIQAFNGSVKDANQLAAYYGIVGKDRNLQISFLLIAASNNSSQAAYNLGQIYSYDPVIMDIEKSKYWFNEAVKLGDKSARTKLFKLEKGVSGDKSRQTTNQNE